MAQPFVLLGIDVEFGPHGMRIEIALGPGIDQRPRLMAEGPPLQIAFDEIGLRERSQILRQPANARKQRIIAPQRMLALEEIPHRHAG